MALTVFEEFKSISTSSLDEIKNLIHETNSDQNQFIFLMNKKEHRKNMRASFNIQRMNTIAPNVTPVTPVTPANPVKPKGPPAVPKPGTKAPNVTPVTPK
jgi:hypothetical protein